MTKKERIEIVQKQIEHLRKEVDERISANNTLWRAVLAGIGGLILFIAKTTASGRETRRASERCGVQARQRTQRFSLQEGRWGRKENPMHDWQSLSQVRGECKYQVVIIPKYRKRGFSGKLRRQLGPILRELCRQKGSELLEGHGMPEPVHLCRGIPPKYSVAYPLGYRKGKSAVRIPRELWQERRMTGVHCWAAGYCVSTVGVAEARVRQYIREQEEIEQRQGEFQFA